MKKHLRIATVLVLAAALAGCQGPCQKLDRITGPALTSGTADFTRFVAVGTSISAGYQSGGIVDRHQARAFPALFARQVGKTVLTSGAGDFSFDAVDGNGIGPLLQLRSLSPPIISNSGLSPGNPVNLAQAGDYQNLGVPGALAFDFADSSSYYTNNAPIFRSNPIMFQLIARGRGTLAQQLLRQAPTFISFEYGANEVLGSATNGVATQVFPPSTYAAIVHAAMDSIHTYAPNAKLAIFNVPDVTAIPFCTTYSPATVSLTTGTLVSLIGPGGTALDPLHDLVLITAAPYLAAGIGFPVGSYNYTGGLPGNGQPLPDAVVLSQSEQTIIGVVTSAMNAAVDSIATRPWVVKVDLHGLLGGIAQHGYQIGPTLYTSAFVTGGLFSLDGVHPTDLGHALIANAMIDAVNVKFGATIPDVDLGTAASLTASSARPASAGEGTLREMRLQGLEQAFGMVFPRQR